MAVSGSCVYHPCKFRGDMDRFQVNSGSRVNGDLSTSSPLKLFPWK
jgi:hypothetical protein